MSAKRNTGPCSSCDMHFRIWLVTSLLLMDGELLHQFMAYRPRHALCHFRFSRGNIAMHLAKLCREPGDSRKYKRCYLSSLNQPGIERERGSFKMKLHQKMRSSMLMDIDAFLAREPGSFKMKLHQKMRSSVLMAIKSMDPTGIGVV